VRPAAFPVQPPASRRHGVTLVAAFCSLGIVSATVPASIPATAARLGVPAAELLPAVSLLFLGLLAGVLVTVVPRTAERVFLVLGLLLDAAALLLLAAAPTTTVFFAGSALAGVGFGLAEASASSLTRMHAGERTPGRLTLLNGATAVAAALTPLLLVVSGSSGSAVAIAVLATVPAAGAVIALSAWSPWSRPPAPRARVRPTQQPPTQRTPRLPRSLLLAGAALFVFVGAETVLAGWSSVLPQALFQLSPGTAAVGTTVFWLLMAAGRFLCAAILRRGLRVEAYLAITLSSAAVLVVVAALLPERTVAGIVSCLVVVLVAPGYALLLGRALVGVSAGSAGRITGWLVAVGSSGGAAISYVVAITVGAVPIAVLCCVGILLGVCGVLSLLLARSHAARAANAPPPHITPAR
jgi:fucose permease